MTTDIEPMATGLARDSAVPLYAQLEEIFRAQIAGGQWAPGDRIPSENELNRIFNVSRMTVRGVLTRLVEDGLLVRVAGKGTFVAKKKIETNTRHWTLFRHAQIHDAFTDAGWPIAKKHGQFFFPMVVHRMLKCRPLSAGLESVSRALGLNDAWGSPIIFRAEPKRAAHTG